MRTRPMPVTVAAILLALFCVLYDLSFALWANAIPREEAAPAFIIYLTVVVGIAGLIGAAGLWMLRKWGMWLSIVVCVLNILDAAPGVGAPNAALQVVAAVLVVVFALIIVLVVLPTSRVALATPHQPTRVVR